MQMKFPGKTENVAAVLSASLLNFQPTLDIFANLGNEKPSGKTYAFYLSDDNVAKLKKMAEKRIRRSLTQIVLDKVDEKGKGLDQRSYLAIRKRIESALNDLEELIKKENSTKLTKGKINRLSKFTKEELEEYLKTL